MSRQIPEGWKAGVLTDFAEINPRLAQRSELEEDTLVSFIRMEDVSNNAIVKNVRIVSYEQVSKGFTTFQDKDVLLAKITPCFENGKGGFVDNLQNGVGFGSTEFHVLRAKENSDPHFIYQVTNYPEFRIKGETNMTGSAGQRRVPTDYLKTFDVVFPPLPEQQKIATILTSVDTVIEKTRAQIDKLKDLKTGMMQELLTQGIGHTEFKDTPVGRIPKNWEVVQFKDVFTLNYGKSPKDIAAEHGANTVWGTGGETAKTNSFLYEGESIVLGRKGTIDQPRYVTGKFWVIDTAYYSSNHGENNVRFLHYALQIKNLRALNEASGVPSLSRDTLYAEWLALPDPVEQQAIAETLYAIEVKIAVTNKKLSSFEKNKKALMQDLLSGKVRTNYK